MTEKEQAKRMLNDEIFDIQMKLERAEAVLNEVENYFDYNEKQKDGQAMILYGHSRNAILMDVVCDYLFAIRKGLKALTDI